ncbi:MAG: hypothetical protein JJ916_08590 [Phycisphaerales bacterium]|nr:hypothetical protein [Phycisphaerales bacterium]
MNNVIATSVIFISLPLTYRLVASLGYGAENPACALQLRERIVASVKRFINVAQQILQYAVVKPCVQAALDQANSDTSANEQAIQLCILASWHISYLRQLIDARTKLG